MPWIVVDEDGNMLGWTASREAAALDAEQHRRHGRDVRVVEVDADGRRT